MEDLKLHTAMVITEGSNPAELERPYTRLRKKTLISTSGILEDEFNLVVPKKPWLCQRKDSIIHQGGKITQVRNIIYL